MVQHLHHGTHGRGRRNVTWKVSSQTDLDPDSAAHDKAGRRSSSNIFFIRLCTPTEWLFLMNQDIP
jgi:hypothetical protein